MSEKKGREMERSRKRNGSMRRIAAILTAAAAMVLGSVTNAPVSAAEASGPNGRIVFIIANFVRDRDTVYLIDPDGTNLEKLDPWRSEFFEPRWSPDGTEIDMYGDACGVIHERTCAVVIVNPDTGSYRWLPVDRTLAGSFGCPTWSPDGSLLACSGVKKKYPDAAGIYTLRSSDGGDLTRVLQFDPTKRWEDFPIPRDFTPDGTQLLYEQTAGLHRTGLFLINLDGTGKRRVTPEGLILNHDEEASFSPTGDWILFTAYPDGNHRRTVYLIRPDGTDLHEVFPDCGGRFSKPLTIGCGNASWSPDGSRIIYQRVAPHTRGGYTVRIMTAFPDGTGQELVTSRSAYPLVPELPDWGTHPEVPLG
jgi:Tol biopolymer transport system component